MKQETKVKIVRLDSTDDKMILRIKVGNGHPSLTTIYRNGIKIIELSDPYADCVIDSKKNLIGSDMLVSTVVHDLAGTPDHVIVSHKLFDAQVEIMTSDFEIDVDDGEVAICSTQIYFLNK